MQNRVKIGMFGYGVVGQGLHDVLLSSRGFRSDIKKICVKDRTKKRRINPEHFTFDRDEILNDDEINLVVELISDAEEAYHIVKRALISGKNVVSANKRMLAQHLPEMIELQKKHNVSLLYEAACCGCIPIIRNLEEYYDNEMLLSVRGIFNGSTNFILSKMYNENSDYATVLKQAQELGYAEADPALDVEGYDARDKLAIISLHAFGLFLDPEEIFTYGITNISPYDLQYAHEKGLKLKLVPTVRKIDESTIASYVIPQFVQPQHFLFNVENEYNGVVTEAAFSNKQFFYGKGAGGHPTGSAVLSDISANSYEYRYEYKKLFQKIETNYTRDIPIEIYYRYHHKKDLDIIPFTDILESYKSREYNFVVGTISLNDLYKLRPQLSTMNVFLARTPEKGVAAEQ
ncbi:MAG: homoserine dehydrogenase [Bacteroidetes bacterium]|nr:homoserine dehydrogenase [Bacteroidota bacterium]